MTVSTNDATSCGRGSPAARTHASTARFHAVKFSAMSAFSVSISSASRPIGQPYRQSVSTSRRRYRRLFIAIAAVISLRRRRWREFLQTGVAVLATAALIDQVLKPLVGRERPFERMPAVRVIGGRPDNGSFPSGHAGDACAGAIVLAGAAPGGAVLWWALRGHRVLARGPGGPLALRRDRGRADRDCRRRGVVCYAQKTETTLTSGFGRDTLSSKFYENARIRASHRARRESASRPGPRPRGRRRHRTR